MIERRALSSAFLDRAGWGGAERRFLAGDASDRSYDRLTGPSGTAVLMDAPPGKGDDPRTFARIARHLAGLGLSPPAILAEDFDHGFLLLEDLGDDLLARLVAKDAALEAPLYSAATDVLFLLQADEAPMGLPDLSAAEWAQAAAFALDWYAFAATGNAPDCAEFVAILTGLIRTHADGPRVMILRDYHAENLLWLPDRSGAARVGLLDFQLAQMGQPGYDLVSLLQDARRDVSATVEAAMIARFCAAQGTDPGEFAAAYATLGAQRALRILGIFARLCLKGGKPGYLAMIPRVWSQLWRNLNHPALSPLVAICKDHLPPPTPETLERISAQCGLHPHR
ncbi:MAG: phosphotransferase [Paracoccaceae bacterium]